MFRIETIWNKSWTVTIDKADLIVRVIKETPCGSSAIVREFQAKSTRQAWFAYFNPTKIKGLLFEYV